jgi:hypothetical protein
MYTTARVDIVAIVTAVVVQFQASTAVLAETIPAHPQTTTQFRDAAL